MKSSLFKNLRLQTYLQLLNAIIPLITTPYIARVLGASMVGVFSSSHSIASFFTLFALMGINNYGIRCISAENDNKKRKTLFIEIYSLQLITCIFSSVCYSLYCTIFAYNNIIAYLQFITLFGCFFDISWLFWGVENFKITVLCNMFFRLTSVILLFSAVKSSNDLWIYTIITLTSPIMSHLVLWILMLKNGYLRTRLIALHNIKKHFTSNVKLFIPLLAMTIYTSTDKAMLGTLSTYEQAGYYSNIDRIINVPFSFFSGIGIVFLPRMTAIYSKSEKKAKEFFFDTLSGIIMLGVAISGIIFSIADEFIPFFLGVGYEPCISITKIFSPIIIIKCISNAIKMHYLIPFKREDIFIKATTIGATLNVVLNYLLIPRYGALAAVSTTLVSEIIVLTIQVFFAFKRHELISTVKDVVAYIFIGISMITMLDTISFESHKTLMKMVFDVSVCLVVYCGLTILYWKLSRNKFYEIYVRPRMITVIHRMNNR